jgi:adenosine deaminase CECR1
MMVSRFYIVSFFLIYACIFNGGVADRLYAQMAGRRAEKKRSSAGPVAAYELRRQKMVQEDSLRSFDASIRLTALEERANQKLVALQREMILQYDSLHFFPPAHSFYKSKEHIYRTPLFGLLKQMPKGGIHHLHPAAGGSYWWIINRALTEPDCYVFWQRDSGQFVKGQLRFFSKEAVPPGFYPVNTLNDSIPSFPQQLHDLLTFDRSIGRDSVDIWGEFEKCFKRVGGFHNYQPVFEDFYTAMFDSLAADGVQHVEMRTHLGGNLYSLQDASTTYSYDSVIHYLRRAVQRVRAAGAPDFSIKLIYSSTRFLSLEAIKEDLKRAFAIRKKYPDLVVAYDLVGQEDRGNTTHFYRDAWLMRDSLSKVYGIDLPLCLHDGESTWQHVTNVYDAVLLGSTRIGHGFNLSFFPAAEDLVRQQNICIEVSPLSNQILGYIGDLRLHPAHAWIKRGIQISISPDDPAIFDYVGVTPDYWSIFLAWELDLRALKKLAINSIEYSHLNKVEKKKALAAWQQKWDVFINNFTRQL